jgi:hypothetical protein
MIVACVPPGYQKTRSWQREGEIEMGEKARQTKKRKIGLKIFYLFSDGPSLRKKTWIGKRDFRGFLSVFLPTCNDTWYVYVYVERCTYKRDVLKNKRKRYNIVSTWETDKRNRIRIRARTDQLCLIVRRVEKKRFINCQEPTWKQKKW